MDVRGTQLRRGGAGAGPVAGGAVHGALLSFCSGRSGRAAESDGERGWGVGVPGSGGEGR